MPDLVASTYDKRQEFLDLDGRGGLPQTSSCRTATRGVSLRPTPSATPTACSTSTATHDESSTELYYNDIDNDHYLSDDERDEDADGLTNYDESHGRMNEDYWTGCYSNEKVFHVGYTGTDIVDPDTDGDGVRDGADDQDHDDIPNLAELSRFDASGYNDAEPGTICKADEEADPPLNPKNNHRDAYGRVTPFNPCLPGAKFSRTCPGHQSQQQRGCSVRRLAELVLPAVALQTPLLL